VKQPTPLSVITDQVDAIMVTGALRGGHWLHYRELEDGYMVLFVADDLADEAKRLWPLAIVSEPKGYAAD
jgi:hypothetical protein